MPFLFVRLMHWRAHPREYKVFLKLQGNTYHGLNRAAHMTDLEVLTIDLIHSEPPQLVHLQPKQLGRPMQVKATYSGCCKLYNIA